MIKREDLFIGAVFGLTRHEGFPVTFTIDSISAQGVLEGMFSDGTDTISSTALVSDLAPIPLTAEILDTAFGATEEVVDEAGFSAWHLSDIYLIEVLGGNYRFRINQRVKVSFSHIHELQRLLKAFKLPHKPNITKP